MTALVVANWKMNGSAALVREWLAGWEAVRDRIPDSVRAVVCPPSPFLGMFSGRVGRAGRTGRAGRANFGLALGGQDCSVRAESGARTGEVSAGMLAEMGCEFVLVGHSERRQFFGEDGESCRAKIRAAHSAGLTPILCVGESAAERKRGQTAKVIRAQLQAALGDFRDEGGPDGPEISEGSAGPDGSVSNGTGGSDGSENFGEFRLVVGYEPVWAIGGGGTPAAAEIAEAHRAVGDFFRKNESAGGKCDIIRVVYGGSVGASNAAEIFAARGVGGALVGGASLRAADFARICRAAGAISEN